MTNNKQKIAVVGAGVAGITAAHILQREHDVTIFEKNNYLGGHTNTIVIQDGPDAGVAVDTGFIVLNNETYPTFHRLLQQLGAPVRNSDMSFGFHCEKTGLQYCGDNLNSLFAQRKNILNIQHWKMIFDILKFGKVGYKQLEQENIGLLTLGDFVEKFGFSNSFIENYIAPMGAAIWSTPSKEMMRFPAKTFLEFFHHHGLPSLKPPQWQTVIGGSHAYIKKFIEQFKGCFNISCTINKVVRDKNGAALEFCNGEKQQFDCVVMAAHADEAFRMLSDPTLDEQRLLGVWKYVKNKIVLHTDESLMPPNPRAWASWNYKREGVENDNNALSMTYYMNRLQGVDSKKKYFVTLNGQKEIASESIIREIEYTHPLYDFDSVQTQSELHKLNGINNTFYCGSYFGYGFHEDAVKSGLQVAHLFGLDL